MNNSQKILLLIIGHLCVALALAGALLPVVPTTPFLILAAYCYSKASPRLHKKILSLPHVGVHIEEWERNKVIRPKAKAGACLVILSLFGSTIYYKWDNVWLVGILATVAVSVMIFILGRKSQVTE